MKATVLFCSGLLLLSTVHANTNEHETTVPEEAVLEVVESELPAGDTETLTLLLKQYDAAPVRVHGADREAALAEQARVLTEIQSYDWSDADPIEALAQFDTDTTPQLPELTAIAPVAFWADYLSENLGSFNEIESDIFFRLGHIVHRLPSEVESPLTRAFLREALGRCVGGAEYGGRGNRYRDGLRYSCAEKAAHFGSGEVVKMAQDWFANRGTLGEDKFEVRGIANTALRIMEKYYRSLYGADEASHQETRESVTATLTDIWKEKSLDKELRSRARALLKE